MKHEVIEIVYSDINNYYIYKTIHGYNAEVKTRSRWKLLKERISDYLGATDIHPVFFSAFNSNTIESMRWRLFKHIFIENGER